MADEKVRENRLRKMAKRQGYELQKSRRRDPRAIDYGGWMIVDPDSNGVVEGSNYSMDLDAIEEWLLSE